MGIYVGCRQGAKSLRVKVRRHQNDIREVRSCQLFVRILTDVHPIVLYKSATSLENTLFAHGLCGPARPMPLIHLVRAHDRLKPGHIVRDAPMPLHMRVHLHVRRRVPPAPRCARELFLLDDTSFCALLGDRITFGAARAEGDGRDV